VESKVVATLEMFSVSSLKFSGILTKFPANKSVADTADVVRILVNRLHKKKTKTEQI